MRDVREVDGDVVEDVAEDRPQELRLRIRRGAQPGQLLGRVLLDLGVTAEASSAFRRVLELDPENRVALRTLGDLNRTSGNRNDALDYYRKLQLLDLFREKLASFTKTLGEREEDILRNRVLSETPVTLEDLGQKYGITKERTRQLEARMIKRLREYLQKEVKDFDQLRS